MQSYVSIRLDVLAVVLDYDVGCAEVQEASNHIISFKQSFKHLDELFFTLLGVDQILVPLNDVVTL